MSVVVAPTKVLFNCVSNWIVTPGIPRPVAWLITEPLIDPTVGLTTATTSRKLLPEELTLAITVTASSVVLPGTGAPLNPGTAFAKRYAPLASVVVAPTKVLFNCVNNRIVTPGIPTPVAWLITEPLIVPTVGLTTEATSRKLLPLETPPEIVTWIVVAFTRTAPT